MLFAPIRNLYKNEMIILRSRDFSTVGIPNPVFLSNGSCSPGAMMGMGGNSFGMGCNNLGMMNMCDNDDDDVYDDDDLDEKC